MSQFEWVQSGEIHNLDFLRQQWNGTNKFIMHLFTADTVSNHNPSIANFTEASFTGYSAVDITSFQTPTHPSASQHAVSDVGTDPVFTNNSGSPQNVKGIFVTDSSGTPVLLGWGYFLQGGTDITIQNGSTLTVPSSASLKTIFEHSFQ